MNKACNPVLMSRIAGLFLIGQFEGSACIGIVHRISKIPLLKPGLFLIILRDVDPLDLENNGAGSIIAASDHHAVIVCPALHDRAALESGVNVPADRVPGLSAELTVHQMIKVILLRRTLQQKGAPRLEKWTRPGLGISQVLFLKLRKAFCLQNGDLTFVFHTMLPPLLRL